MSDKKEGLFLRLLMPLDERVSVKLLLRVWGPRFEFVVRLILVATFFTPSGSFVCPKGCSTRGPIAVEKASAYVYNERSPGY